MSFFIVFSVISGGIVFLSSQRERERLDALQGSIAHSAHDIEMEVDRLVAWTRAVSVVVEQGGGSLQNFEGLAERILQDQPAVAAVLLAPKGIVEVQHPGAPEGGKQLWQDDSLASRLVDSLETGRPVLSLPFQDEAGAWMLEMYRPVTVEEVFWGFVGLRLSLDVLLRESHIERLSQLSNIEADYQLLYQGQDLTWRSVGSYSSLPAGKTLEHAFSLLGDPWLIKANYRLNRNQLYILGVALALVLGLFVAYAADAVRQLPGRLKAQVALSTRRLREANLLLSEEIDERREVELALRYRQAFENLMATVSTRFISATPSGIDREIDQALRAFAEFFEMDRAYLCEIDRSLAPSAECHGWCVPEDDAEKMVVLSRELSAAHYLMSVVDRGELFWVRHLDELPPEALQERAWLESREVKEHVTAPIVVGGELRATVSFEATSTKQPWLKDGASLFRLIAELFSNALERRHSAIEARNTFEFRQLTTELSTKFINLDTEMLDQEIDAVLESVGRYAGAEHGYIFQLLGDGDRVIRTHSWCAESVEDVVDSLDDFPEQTLKMLMLALIDSDYVYIPSVSMLPTDNHLMQGILEESNLKTVVAIPLRTSAGFRGFLGFDTVTEERHWSEETLSALRIVAEICINAIERKQTDAELKAQRNFAMQVVATMGQGLAVLGRDNTFKFVNPALATMLEYEADAFIGKSLLDIVAPEQKPQVSEAMSIQRVSKQTNYETVAHKADGSAIDIFVTGAPLIKDNELTATIVVITDLTEQKQQQNELLAREQLLEGIFTASPDLVLLLDLKGNILFRSSASEQMLGFGRNNIGSNLLDNVHPADQESVRYQLRSLSDGRSDFVNGFRARVQHRGGRWLTLEANGRVLEYDGGEANGIVLIVRDVTAQVELEEDLMLASAEAERANKAKSVFLSRMSHELRTPLNAILGFAQLLEMDRLSASQARGVGHILKAGEHLMTLINEVLDIVRIEAGRLQLSLEPINVEGLIKEELDLIMPLAQAKGIEVRTAFEGDAYAVLADRQRLAQIMLNLLSNAVKYNSEGGEIEVGAARAEDSRLKLWVRDTGIGIAPDQFERLFTPFDRLDVERFEIDGSGLGLTVVKQLVEAMSGEIEVFSEVDIGSTFTIYLPQVGLAETASDTGDLPEEPEPLPVHELSGKHRVLYIEDNASNLELIARIFDFRQDLALLSATRARAGLERARRERPDLILLDLQLPDANGDEVLESLRQSPQTADIPVVVISADATKNNVDHLLNLGAQAYLTKPINLQILLETIDRTLTSAEVLN